MNVDQLNTEFGITDQVTFITGKGGLPIIKVRNDKATTLISVYAGQVLSFKPIEELEDLMFLSEKAYYQVGKAIKGGIPICWPWFGPDPEGLGRPGHGFVRNRQWAVLGSESNGPDETKLRLGLEDTAETREIWPYAFELVLEITVGSSLTLELITYNKGDETFSITQALHTYFKVGDIGRVRVLGLEDKEYLDKVDNGKSKSQTGEITIGEEVDRIYTGVDGELIIDDAALQRRIRIVSAGSKTAVVWNPWIKISAEMGDLEDEDYQRLLCVESANAANDIVEVPPASDYRLRVNYQVESMG